MEIKKEANAMESMVLAAREAKNRVEGNIYHGVVITALIISDMVINRGYELYGISMSEWYYYRNCGSSIE